MNRTWICCQLGSRVHYSVPRAIKSAGRLGGVVTDYWQPPKPWLKFVPKINGRRYHPELEGVPVKSHNLALSFFEIRARVTNLQRWDRTMARNAWFEDRAVQDLNSFPRKITDNPGILFSYSYAAREPFRWAKRHGWKTVLGQIDLGPVEERIVERDSRDWAHLAPPFNQPPEAYWSRWREEIELADSIVVNSEWARSGLLECKVPTSRITVMPVPYEKPFQSVGAMRLWPEKFTSSEPLKVLFFGNNILRKGIGQLFGAINKLESDSIRFTFAGPLGVKVPSEIKADKRAIFHGVVSQAMANELLDTSHVFILPTLSDAFALTQLESLSRGLPLIASNRCAEVVKPGENGLLLDEVTPSAISEALHWCLANPTELKKFSGNARLDDRFSMNALRENLIRVENYLFS